MACVEPGTPLGERDLAGRVPSSDTGLDLAQLDEGVSDTADWGSAFPDSGLTTDAADGGVDEEPLRIDPSLCQHMHQVATSSPTWSASTERPGWVVLEAVFPPQADGCFWVSHQLGLLAYEELFDYPFGLGANGILYQNTIACNRCNKPAEMSWSIYVDDIDHELTPVRTGPIPGLPVKPSPEFMVERRAGMYGEGLLVTDRLGRSAVMGCLGDFLPPGVRRRRPVARGLVESGESVWMVDGSNYTTLFPLRTATSSDSPAAAHQVDPSQVESLSALSGMAFQDVDEAQAPMPPVQKAARCHDLGYYVGYSEESVQLVTHPGQGFDGLVWTTELDGFPPAAFRRIE